MASKIDGDPSMWNILPIDLVKYIFSHLTAKELCHLLMVCKSWKNIISQIPKICCLFQEYESIEKETKEYEQGKMHLYQL